MADYEKEKIIEAVRMLQKNLDQLQEEVPEFTDDYHRLFLYFIADQFENIPPSKVKICDRKGDQKIDFYQVGEDKFIAYQCKLPEFENLEMNGKVKSYGPDIINEAEDILTFMTDEEGFATGNPDTLEARNKFRERKKLSKEADTYYKLEVVLAFFGKLTPPAEERLQELKTAWGADSDESEFEITIVDFSKIETELSLSHLAKNRPKKARFDFVPGTQVNTDQWGYALVPAIQFYLFFQEYKMALFDLNVRYYLRRSSVNKQIIRTLTEMKGQKKFHLLNNGVTISCLNWHFPSKKKDDKKKGDCWFTLTKPQIINGCQTVISIYRAYRQITEENLRENFKNKCYVPVRIIKIDQKHSDLLDEIVMSSNNQNKMSPRNLRSNDRIQRILQRKFDHLDFRWFYERKDSEFESTKEYSDDFKIKNYQYSPNGQRVVSNEDIARCWLSFIGLSKDSSEKINAFDFDDENERYEWLFARPK